MKKGAIFDMDGTLIDTVDFHTRAWQTLFSRYGIELSDEEKKEHSGKTNVFFIELVLGRRNLKNLDAKALSHEKDEIVIDALQKEPPHPFPGVEELLTTLKNGGIKLALATSATKATAELLAGSLINSFEATVFAEEIIRGKPDPEIFLKAAAKLDLQPAECIVFEDAESGVRAAKAGGFYCVAKENHVLQNLAGADFIIENYKPQELIKLFWYSDGEPNSSSSVENAAS